MWYMTQERKMLVRSFREFAQKEIRPLVPKMEEEDFYPKDTILELGQLGMLGLGIDEKYGGLGKDYISFGLMLEEFAKESHTFALLTYLASPLTIGLISQMGTPEQVERFVRPALAGDKLLSIQFTEPCGITNCGDYETTAVIIDDEVIINGGKVLITNVDVADISFVLCKTSEYDPKTLRGLTFVALPSDTKGYTPGHIENKLGWKGSHTGQVYYNDCHVPKSNIIGEVDNAWLPINTLLGPEFAYYGPMNLGSMEACFAKTENYLRNRIEFGVSLWDSHEVIRNEMAHLWCKIDNYRAAVYSALQDRCNGENISAQATALKVEGEKLLSEVAGTCIELNGGMGTVYETGIERYYRDAKMGALGCGSNRTMINVLGSMI